MNPWRRLILIGVAGFVSVCVLYPCLHELGHGIMACICGADEIRMSIFPTAYTAYKNANFTPVSQVLIGLSGYGFPLCLTLLPTADKFWIWLPMFYVRWITLIGCGIAIIGLLGAVSGSVCIEEDITRLVTLTRSRAEIWLVGVCMMAVWLLWDMIRNKPITKIVEYICIA